jgi:hypothetical protein
VDLAFDVPVNAVSFGQVSYNLLYELYTRGESPYIFVKDGNAQLNSFIHDEDFGSWLRSRMEASLASYDRDIPSVKLWHISGLLESYSAHASAFTFHETDRVTPFERCALSAQEKVFVSSSFTKKTFNRAGLENIVLCPLGFDSRHFKKLPDQEFEGITFGIRGKLEARKNTLRIIKLWADKYGNNWDYKLDCSIFNPFLKPEDQDALIEKTLGGKIPANINFLPMQVKNEDYNKCLNAVDIDLTGMSGCEGYNLPLFQSLCLGKWAVVLDAHVHRDYATKENSVLVKIKDEKVLAHDGLFFHSGQNYNQGRWFDFHDEDFISAMEQAEGKAKTPNPAGEALAEEYTYAKTLDTILENFTG